MAICASRHQVFGEEVTIYPQCQHVAFAPNSTSRSQTLEGFSTELPPDLWPTHLLCRDSVKKLAVELHVLLIVYDIYVTDTVLSYLQRVVKELNVTVVRSTGSRKLGAWFKFLTPSTVSQYDYIWLADGDVKVSAINWFSFWAHMLYFKPLIAQPSIIGHLEKFQELPRGSDHPILNLPFDRRANVWNTDVTLIAAEVGIVEMMAAVLTAETWLAVRNGSCCKQQGHGSDCQRSHMVHRHEMV